MSVNTDSICLGPIISPSQMMDGGIFVNVLIEGTAHSDLDAGLNIDVNTVKNSAMECTFVGS